MKTIRNFLICSCLILSQNLLNAKHLTGGTMSYKCLGNNDYEISLNVFRDANCLNCADFDQFAAVTIYKCTPGTDCNALSQDQPLFNLQVPISDIETVVFDSTYQCLENTCELPKTIIIQQATYNFKLSDFNVNLPKISESYFIVYQRCCIPEHFVNILNPGEQGFTASAEITPTAQTVCNSMPVLENFSSVYYKCAGEPSEIKLPIKDPEGDIVTYRFCSPVAGGGRDISTGYNSCQSALPNPACPPPYNSITFATPFSFHNPFETESGFSMDLVSGILAFSPSSIGSYLSAICVDEYRNGIRLSSQTVGFQVVVVSPCEPNEVSNKDLNSQIKLFPNPAKEEIKIEIIQDFNLDFFNIKNLAGKELMKGVLNNSKTIQVSNLLDGFYFLELRSEKRIFVKKLIINRMN